MPRPRTGSVERHRLPDGSWHFDIRWTLNDGSRSKPLCLPKGTSEAMAREKAKAYTERARTENTTRPVVLPDGSVAAADKNIAALATRWLGIIEAGTLAPATKAGHKTNVNARVVPKLGHLRPDELKTGHVLAWLREIGAGLSASKTRDTFNTLAKMLDDCAAENWIDLEVNPCRHKKVREAVPTVEAPEDDGVQTMSIAQVSTMLRAPAPMVQWLRELVGATTGMREEEVAGLRFDRIEQREGVDLYRVKDVVAHKGDEGHATTKATKTKSSRRVIPIHPQALPYLKAWRESGWRAYVGREPTDEDYLFPTPSGEAFRPRSAQLIRDHLTAAGLSPNDEQGRPFTFKCLRASFNTWLRAAGVDLETRERLTGHAKGSVNERHYTGADYAGLARAVSTIRLDLGDDGRHERGPGAGWVSPGVSPEGSDGAAADARKAKQPQQLGGVAEWSKAAVLKTAVPKGTGSSNLSSSARRTPGSRSGPRGASAAHAHRG